MQVHVLFLQFFHKFLKAANAEGCLDSAPQPSLSFCYGAPQNLPLNGEVYFPALDFGLGLVTFLKQ